MKKNFQNSSEQPRYLQIGNDPLELSSAKEPRPELEESFLEPLVAVSSGVTNAGVHNLAMRLAALGNDRHRSRKLCHAVQTVILNCPKTICSVGILSTPEAVESGY